MNAIYLNREKGKLSLDGNSEVTNINGSIKLVNLSDETQRFYVKVKLPYFYTEEIEDKYIILRNEYTLNPKEEIYLQISEEERSDINDNTSFYQAKADGYVLFNEDEEVIFESKY